MQNLLKKKKDKPKHLIPNFILDHFDISVISCHMSGQAGQSTLSLNITNIKKLKG